MANKQEQFNELQKKNLEAAMRLAQLSIENSQRIMEIQVTAAKSLFEEGVHNAKAMSTSQGPEGHDEPARQLRSDHHRKDAGLRP